MIRRGQGRRTSSVAEPGEIVRARTLEVHLRNEWGKHAARNCRRLRRRPAHRRRWHGDGVVLPPCLFCHARRDRDPGPQSDRRLPVAAGRDGGRAELRAADDGDGWRRRDRLRELDDALPRQRRHPPAHLALDDRPRPGRRDLADRGRRPLAGLSEEGRRPRPGVGALRLSSRPWRGSWSFRWSMTRRSCRRWARRL